MIRACVGENLVDRNQLVLSQASAIGNFDVKLLQVLADFIISDIFMPILNSYGYKVDHHLFYFFN